MNVKEKRVLYAIEITIRPAYNRLAIEKENNKFLELSCKFF